MIDFDTIDARLRDLGYKVDQAIREARDEHINTIEGGVNWADLGLEYATHTLRDDGKSTYRVVISEADPSAVEFQEFIANRVREYGWDEPLEVVTEW